MRNLRHGRSSQWRKLRNIHRMSSSGAGFAGQLRNAGAENSPPKPPTPYGLKAEKNTFLRRVLSLRVKELTPEALQQDSEPPLSENDDSDDNNLDASVGSAEMRAMNERVRINLSCSNTICLFVSFVFVATEMARSRYVWRSWTPLRKVRKCFQIKLNSSRLS